MCVCEESLCEAERVMYGVSFCEPYLSLPSYFIICDIYRY